MCTACFPCGLQSLALHGLIWFIYAMMEKRDRACYSDAVAREQQERVEVRNKEDKVRSGYITVYASEGISAEVWQKSETTPGKRG